MSTPALYWEVNELSLWAVLEDVPLPPEVVRVLRGAASAAVLTPQGTTVSAFLAGLLPARAAVPLEVSSFQAAFAVNAVPTGVLKVALGRRTDNLLPAAIHRLIDNLRSRLPISVYLAARTVGALGRFLDVFGFSSWPSNRPFRVFLGRTVGHHFDRSSQTANLTLTVKHWALDLETGSAVSQESSPKNPNDLIFGATTPLLASIQQEPQSRGFLCGSNLVSNFFPNNLAREDLWAGREPDRNVTGLRALFHEMASRRFLAQTLFGAPLTGLADQLGEVTPNAAGARARAALERFEPLVGEGRRWSVPLRLRVFADSEQETAHINTNLVHYFSLTTLQSLGTTTVWDKLVEHSGMLLFGIVPRVETALVVPYLKGLNRNFKTIHASEYAFVGGAQETIEHLRGVAIIGGYNYPSGGQLVSPGGGAALATSIGGLFDAQIEGKLRVLQGPPWLTNLPTSQYAPAAVGAGQERSTALSPGVGAGPAPSLVSSYYRTASRFLDAFAQAVYVNEALAGRQCEVAGRLRFDLAPGSAVTLEIPGEEILGLSDRLGNLLYGTLLQVSFTIDVENRQAGTVFHLSHLRTANENDSATCSVADHPLWQDSFVGCPLIG